MIGGLIFKPYIFRRPIPRYFRKSAWFEKYDNGKTYYGYADKNGITIVEGKNKIHLSYYIVRELIEWLEKLEVI